MNGVFEVSSIKGDSMIIQLENGKKILTTIEQQQRIIERMEKERQERERLEPKDNINLKNIKEKHQFGGINLMGLKKVILKGM